MTSNQTSMRRPPMTRALPRREWLKAVGLGLLGSGAFAGPANDRKANPRRNVKLGIYSGVYSGLPLEEAATRIKAHGFTSVLTNYVFADVRFDPLAPDWKAAERIVDCLNRHGLRIAAIFGYYNVVDPDPAKRRRGESRMDVFMANWKRLGCPVISTETGTLNPKSEWLDSPENDTEATYLLCRSAFQKLARKAEKTGAVISIEPYWRNVIGTIDRAERLFREVNSPGLKLVMDPCNYFRKQDLPRMRPMLEDMFKRLGRRIVVAHAKDVKAAAEGTDLPASGRGVLDYPLYLRLLAELDRPMDLIVEHLMLDDVPRARDFVLAQFDKI